MPDEDLVSYTSLTCGIALDEENQMVVLIFQTREGKTVQIGLSGSGLAGVARVIQKLADSHPHVMKWQSELRH